MKNRILVTFAGNTDPTRGQHDGPILHICRHYKPDVIYLILTSEMEERDKEPYNIYEKSIQANLERYSPKIIRKITKIRDAHLFDSYFDVIYNVFEEIKQEKHEMEIYVNLSSGTTQMTANLISYILDATDIRITPLQVATPAGKSNEEPPVNKHYDVGLEAECNLDNTLDSKTNRVISPDLKRYSRVLVKKQIQKLLEQYEYASSLEILRREVFANQLELTTLLNFAIDRKNLKGFECNKKLNALNNKNYDKFYYFLKDKDKKRAEEWYKIVDYFAVANIKQKSGDISGYVLMLEPIVVNIYISILQDIMRKDLKEHFDQIKNKDNDSYKINVSKLKSKEGLKKYLEDNIGSSLKDNEYLSNKVLVATIKYYLEKQAIVRDGMEKAYFDEFSEVLGKMKLSRNMIAHSLKSVSKLEFEEESGLKIDQINSKILDFFERFYKRFGYRKDMINLYDNINQEINKLLM